MRANVSATNTVMYGVQKIALEENCSPVRVGVWFRISVRIRAGGNFPRTVMYKCASYKYYKHEKKALSKTLYIY